MNKHIRTITPLPLLDSTTMTETAWKPITDHLRLGDAYVQSFQETLDNTIQTHFSTREWSHDFIDLLQRVFITASQKNQVGLVRVIVDKLYAILLDQHVWIEAMKSAIQHHAQQAAFYLIDTFWNQAPIIEHVLDEKHILFCWAVQRENTMVVQKMMSLVGDHITRHNGLVLLLMALEQQNTLLHLVFPVVQSLWSRDYHVVQTPECHNLNAYQWQDVQRCILNAILLQPHLTWNPSFRHVLSCLGKSRESSLVGDLLLAAANEEWDTYWSLDERIHQEMIEYMDITIKAPCHEVDDDQSMTIKASQQMYHQLDISNPPYNEANDQNMTIKASQQTYHQLDRSNAPYNEANDQNMNIKASQQMYHQLDISNAPYNEANDQNMTIKASQQMYHQEERTAMLVHGNIKASDPVVSNGTNTNNNVMPSISKRINPSNPVTSLVLLQNNTDIDTLSTNTLDTLHVDPLEYKVPYKTETRHPLFMNEQNSANWPSNECHEWTSTQEIPTIACIV